ncbi:cellulosomal bifunctional enzyme-binding/scaffoldin-anchoring protein, putative [Trichomonas vaginalis G3]|uniref:Cellulosomal bifunctional enzyme-binding/scaffoldin-anchoring protein, putative n=1 Tax=Trichomonas vaginalis (strain ATCC PRA-98 / G3) TaxID=412133 RepID=A2FDT6_TRIV3|nr:hypothetical protein TVAGG3_0371220 [Trichomonas vaginalis G3]EAX96935.1 cellulosomal bifunctional enzyme-binding/scaffoldin-anchoring protein, putative [Trichomonas vaginalis G3]KAI5532618.1 hypothetical protein TVAGG3_0371220 [Trichomonas vaginalis G3]|eukprot:XP_001309865.1 cellulosomal bifunctional enzyme-binding/scaffoldin-anchoring protein [Trichomonas vaginalis G3]
MYYIVPNNWDSIKSQVNASYWIATESAKQTMFAQMIDHKVLNSDWTVQQTFFSNNVNSNVNFGSSDFRMSDGYILKAGTSRVQTPFTPTPTPNTPTPTIKTPTPTVKTPTPTAKTPTPTVKTATPTFKTRTISHKTSTFRTRTQTSKQATESATMKLEITTQMLSSRANSDESNASKENGSKGISSKTLFIIIFCVGGVVLLSGIIAVIVSSKHIKRKENSDEEKDRSELDMYLV